MIARFNRGRRVQERAAALHDQLRLLQPWLASLSFEAFAAANQRPGIRVEETDRASRIQVFREQPRGSNFKFFVSYADQRAPNLTAYGERNYLGLVIIAEPGKPISVNRNTSLPASRLGRDFLLLYAELLKLPHYEGGAVELVGSETGVPYTGSRMFRPPNNLDFDDVKPWHPAQMSCMPVAHLKDDAMELIGTCFAIHPSGIMLTARHVLDEALGLVNPDYAALGHDCLEHVGVFFWSNAIDTRNNRPFAGFVAIDWVIVHGSLDIAVFKIVLPGDEKGDAVAAESTTLSPGIPRQGVSCVGFGYPRMRANRNERLQLVLEQDFKQTAGVIEEIHFPQRDNVVLPFPCFRTNARFDGGMSGGPVISAEGQVCGVICSSYDTQDGEGGYISYASLIGPVLGLRTVTKKEDGSIIETLIADLVATGAIRVDQTYKQLKILKRADQQTIDFGGERYWHYGLHSKRGTLKMLDPLYTLKFGNVVKAWHIAALLLGPAALVGFGALALGYSLMQAGTAAGATGGVLFCVLMAAASWLSE